MTQLKINIPDENTQFVISLLEKLGCQVEQKKAILPVKRTVKKEAISSTYLFGKWADLAIDSRELRKNTWRKNR